MRAIERAAGHLFAEIGMKEVAAHDPPTSEVLAGYIRNERAWVAEVDGQLAGYAICDVVDGCGHLEQVSVHPHYGRRGLGRVLIGAIIDWSKANGLPAVTLMTFRDVPWNGPYYSTLGFHAVPTDELTTGLLVLREHERTEGLDTDTRQAMRLDLPVS